MVKYNSGGIFQWVQKGGGTSSEWGQGIATDGSGNVYVTGFFNGTATFGATPITSAGNDIFVVKYNSGGSFQWVQKAVGGTGSEQGLGIATDGSGNVYVTGLV
ncbi:MAG: SBBP repeat-containing protein [Spirosomataceae bacterium]